MGITNEHLKVIDGIVSNKKIFFVEDENGVLHAKYNKLIQIMKNEACQVDKNLKFKSMLIVFCVSELPLKGEFAIVV